MVSSLKDSFNSITKTGIISYMALSAVLHERRRMTSNDKCLYKAESTRL